MHEVASVERQILHLLLLDHAAQHGRLVFEQRRGALDEDGLAQADFQVQVDLGALIHLQLHARALDLAKARGFGGERVAAVVAARLTPVAWLMITTFAARRTAPEPSLIVPTRSAVVTWACAIADESNSKNANANGSGKLSCLGFMAFLLSRTCDPWGTWR